VGVGDLMSFLPLSVAFVAALVVAVAGLARLRGRRLRGIDRAADLTATSAARSVYPESLRGGGPVEPVPPSRTPTGEP